MNPYLLDSQNGCSYPLLLHSNAYKPFPDDIKQHTHTPIDCLQQSYFEHMAGSFVHTLFMHIEINISVYLTILHNGTREELIGGFKVQCKKGFASVILS